MTISPQNHTISRLNPTNNSTSKTVVPITSNLPIIIDQKHRTQDVKLNIINASIPVLSCLPGKNKNRKQTSMQLKDWLRCGSLCILIPPRLSRLSPTSASTAHSLSESNSDPADSNGNSKNKKSKKNQKNKSYSLELDNAMFGLATGFATPIPQVSPSLSSSANNPNDPNDECTLNVTFELHTSQLMKYQEYQQNYLKTSSHHDVSEGSENGCQDENERGWLVCHLENILGLMRQYKATRSLLYQHAYQPLPYINQLIGGKKHKHVIFKNENYNNKNHQVTSRNIPSKDQYDNNDEEEERQAIGLLIERYLQPQSQPQSHSREKRQHPIPQPEISLMHEKEFKRKQIFCGLNQWQAKVNYP